MALTAQPCTAAAHAVAAHPALVQRWLRRDVTGDGRPDEIAVARRQHADRCRFFLVVRSRGTTGAWLLPFFEGSGKPVEDRPFVRRTVTFARSWRAIVVEIHRGASVGFDAVYRFRHGRPVQIRAPGPSDEGLFDGGGTAGTGASGATCAGGGELTVVSESFVPHAHEVDATYRIDGVHLRLVRRRVSSPGARAAAIVNAEPFEHGCPS